MPIVTTMRYNTNSHKGPEKNKKNVSRTAGLRMSRSQSLTSSFGLISHGRRMSRQLKNIAKNKTKLGDAIVVCCDWRQ